MVQTRLDLDTDFRLANLEQELNEFKYQIKNLRDDFDWLKQEVIPTLKDLKGEILFLHHEAKEQTSVQQDDNRPEMVQRVTEVMERSNKENRTWLSQEIKPMLDDLRDELLYLSSLGVKESQVKQNDSLPKSELRKQLKDTTKEFAADLFDKVWDNLSDNDRFKKATDSQKLALKTVFSSPNKSMNRLSKQLGKSHCHLHAALVRLARKLRCSTPKELLAQWQLRVNNYLKEYGDGK
jgi:cation transport regulator ChaB